MNHTDIKINGWIARFLPEKARPYAYLARLDRPIGIWLLLLPAWWAIFLASGGGLSLNGFDAWIVILFGIGAVVMRGAGCVINDLWDRDLDKSVERTRVRPLAAGLIKPFQAIIFLIVLLLLGFLILIQTKSLVTILLGIMTLPLIALYPLMKRLTWWPQLFLGVVFNFGALMGWAAVTGLVQIPAVLLYMGGIFWTLGYDTVYAYQDKEDDARIGIKSTALKFGTDSKKWVGGFYAAAWLLIAAAFATEKAGWLSFMILPLAGYLFFRQLNRWDMSDPQSALDVFRSNRDLGFLILIAAII